MTQQLFLHERWGGGMQKLSSKLSTRAEAVEARRFLDLSCMPRPQMPFDQLRGAEKAPWILRASVRNGAHTCLPWGRRHLLLLVTLTICFYFWRWGRKFIKKSSNTGWLGKILWIQGRKRGGELSKSQNPQACWKTSGQWPCLLVETAQTSADTLMQQTQGQLS